MANFASRNITSYGDSPYQSFSAFAGNTHFIDFDLLIDQGLLDASDVEGVDFWSRPTEVDYAKIFEQRRPLLEKAVKAFIENGDWDDFSRFAEENAAWLELFAEYMAIKEHFELKAWTEWPDAAIRARQPEALTSYRAQLEDKLTYHRSNTVFLLQTMVEIESIR